MTRRYTPAQHLIAVRATNVAQQDRDAAGVAGEEHVRAIESMAPENHGRARGRRDTIAARAALTVRLAKAARTRGDQSA